VTPDGIVGDDFRSVGSGSGGGFTLDVDGVGRCLGPFPDDPRPALAVSVLGFPTTINVGETRSVTVRIENTGNVWISIDFVEVSTLLDPADDAFAFLDLNCPSFRSPLPGDAVEVPCDLQFDDASCDPPLRIEAGGLWGPAIAPDVPVGDDFRTYITRSGRLVLNVAGRPPCEAPATSHPPTDPGLDSAGGSKATPPPTDAAAGPVSPNDDQSAVWLAIVAVIAAIATARRASGRRDRRRT
jgi:hypothetical protein